MTKIATPIDEIDLLAYADGLLEQDPQRKRMVEAYLRAHPDDAARLRAYAVQNQEIRRHYAGVLAEPVPEALTALLEAPARKRARGPVVRIAAAVALVMVGGSAGWLAGSFAPLTQGEDATFIERVAAGYRIAPETTASLAAGEQPPLGWLSEQVSVNIEVPDLSELGLRPVDRRRLPSGDSSRTVSIEYADDADRRLVLFIGTRWHDRVPDVRVVEQDGLSIAYWQDGPLVYGLVAEQGGAPVLSVAETIARRQDGTIAAVPTEPSVMSDVQAMDVSEPAGAPGGEGPPSRPPQPGQAERVPTVN